MSYVEQFIAEKDYVMMNRKDSSQLVLRKGVNVKNLTLRLMDINGVEFVCASKEYTPSPVENTLTVLTATKTMDQLKDELKKVYDSYPEYNDPALGGCGFMGMVNKFAGDDFYKLHYVAKRYKALLVKAEMDEA